jgi:hypothetical protein
LFCRNRFWQRYSFGGGSQWKVNFDQEPALRPVKGRNASTVEAHRSFGDRQTQANSSGLPAPIVIQAVKRLK